jgi:glutamate racemase
MSANAPIGIFDSGVGGLSVAKEIRAYLPAEDLLYFADTANCPYGGRPLEEIRGLSLAVSRELLRRGAKIIVVACNSASAAALESLRASLDVPVVGLEPALKPAAAATRSGRVGVMATEATLAAERFDRLMENHAQGVQVVPQACPGLVEFVEAGDVDSGATRAALGEMLRPLRTAGVDAVVLGCTHYPFLRDVVSDVLGPGVRLFDSGAAVARQVERVLRGEDLLASGGSGSIRMLTSGSPREVGRVAARLWGEALRVEGVSV